MLIRFLNSSEECFQVDTNKTPCLIFFSTKEELEHIKQISHGDCLMSVPKSFSPEDTTRLCEKLNTKEDPKTLK
jgi:hypothetical protein